MSDLSRCVSAEVAVRATLCWLHPHLDVTHPLDISIWGRRQYSLHSSIILFQFLTPDQLEDAALVLLLVGSLLLALSMASPRRPGRLLPLRLP